MTYAMKRPEEGTSQARLDGGMLVLAVVERDAHPMVSALRPLSRHYHCRTAAAADPSPPRLSYVAAEQALPPAVI